MENVRTLAPVETARDASLFPRLGVSPALLKILHVAEVDAIQMERRGYLSCAEVGTLIIAPLSALSERSLVEALDALGAKEPESRAPLVGAATVVVAHGKSLGYSELVRALDAYERDSGTPEFFWLEDFCLDKNAAPPVDGFWRDAFRRGVAEVGRTALVLADDTRDVARNDVSCAWTLACAALSSDDDTSSSFEVVIPPRGGDPEGTTWTAKRALYQFGELAQTVGCFDVTKAMKSYTVGRFAKEPNPDWTEAREGAMAAALEGVADELGGKVVLDSRANALLRAWLEKVARAALSQLEEQYEGAYSPGAGAAVERFLREQGALEVVTPIWERQLAEARASTKAMEQLRIQVLTGYLGSVKLEAGDFGAAKDLLEEAVSLRGELGNNDRRVHLLMAQLAQALLALGDARGAERQFQATVADRRKNMDNGREQPLTLLAQGELANAILDQGRVDQAYIVLHGKDIEAGWFYNAPSMVAEDLGADHPIALRLAAIDARVAHAQGEEGAAQKFADTVDKLRAHLARRPPRSELSPVDLRPFETCVLDTAA